MTIHYVRDEPTYHVSDTMGFFIYNSMAAPSRYLTKSRFIKALECPTKLFYADRPGEFPNLMDEDTFLFELAKGGMQIGELAKFYFVDDPVATALLDRRLGQLGLAAVDVVLGEDLADGFDAGLDGSFVV